MEIRMQKELNEIKEMLVFLSRYIELENSNGEYGINKTAENILAGLLEIVFDCKLNNMNENQRNYPGIDLADTENKIAFQITSENDRKKIIKTISTIKKNELYDKYEYIYIYLLSRKKNYHKDLQMHINEIINNAFVFSVTSNILDMNDIYSKLNNDHDLEKIKKAGNYLREQFERYSMDSVKDENLYDKLLNRVKKRINLVLENSGSYYLEKMTSLLYPNINDNTLHTVIQKERNISSWTEEMHSLGSRLSESWESLYRVHFMMIGEGGSGKTVSMQKTAQILNDTSILSIYIPLHDLNPRECENYIEAYIRNHILDLDIKLWEELHSRCCDGQVQGPPELILFLDGWNEVRDQKIGAYWFKDILKEEIEQTWMKYPGVQVVLSGRERADKDIGWNHHFSILNVMPLEKEQVIKYLNLRQITKPEEDDSIWQTIRNPLMLTLFVNVEGQRTLYQWGCGINFIKGRSHGEQAAVIWNFLQCQIGKFSKQGHDNQKNPFDYYIAINYAASWIGYYMEQRHIYTISFAKLTNLLNEAKENYLIWWGHSIYLEDLRNQFALENWQWDSDRIRSILCDETYLLIKNADDWSENQAVVGFIHQKFRDCYAAMFMRGQMSPYGNNTFPEESFYWRNQAASPEILNLLSTFWGKDQIDDLWDKQRSHITIEENSFVMFHLLELYKRRGYNLSELDFSRQDLRFVSLQNRAGDYSNVNFRGAMISRKTLLPQGHNSTIASVAWVTEAEKNTCDLFFTAGMELCLWNIRYGGMIHKWIPHTSGITCVAVDSNGIKFATVSHDKTVALGSLRPLNDPLIIYSHHAELTAAVFFPNDKFLIVSDEYNRLIVLDYDGNCLTECDYCQDIPRLGGVINSLKCDSTGRFFAARTKDDFLLLWELLIDGRDMEIELLYCEKQPCRVLDLNFDLRGTKLFCVLENDMVVQIDITVATPFSIICWDKKEKKWDSASFSQDGRCLVTYTKGVNWSENKDECSGVMQFWNVCDGNRYGMIDCSYEHNDGSEILMTFSMDCTRVLECITNSGNLYVLNARFSLEEEKNKPLCIIEQPERHIWDLLSISRDNLMFAYGEGNLVIVDIEERQCVKMIKCCRESILCLDLSSDKTKLATVDTSDILRVWDLTVMDDISRVWDFDAMSLCFTKHLSKKCRKVTFSPDGTTLCCICDDSHVYGWNTENYNLQFDIPLKNGERGLSQLFFSENTLLVSTTEGIRWLTLPKGHEKLWPQFHSGFVSVLEMSKDGKYLVSASHDGRIIFYILENLVQIREIAANAFFWVCMAISSDGKYIVGGKLAMDNSNELYRWTVQRHGDEITFLQDTLAIQTMSFNKILFLEEDKRIVCATFEGEILIIRNEKVMELETSFRLVPNIQLVGSDFSYAIFEDEELINLVYMSGGKTQNARIIPSKS